ncbi:MAG: SulP family inorganic anion transporter [Planctomycetaceae bacterium]
MSTATPSPDASTTPVLAANATPPWYRCYRRKWLRADVLAGFTLAAYAVPVSMAYASLAGLPPHAGIYCYLLGGLSYALLGSCRQLAIGPTSAIALVVGSTVAPMAAGDPARWAAIASLAALVVAAVSVVAWLLRLSALVSFISETVLIGFKAGAALTIAMTQLPKLFGVPGGGDYFFERVAVLIGQVGDTNLAVFTLGTAALALLWFGDRHLPNRPIPLLLVVLATMAVSFSALREQGVETVGVIPGGLPALRLPSLQLRDVDGVLPLSCACFLLAYIEGVSAARTLAERHDQAIDPRRELLALGASNLAVAFGQGFPVAGGLSQSAVNDKAGAQTPLSLCIASACIAVFLLFATGLLENLPSVALAAIVLMAVRSLIDFRALTRLWRINRREFGIAIVALVGVLVLGILKGVLVAAIVSLALLIAGVARPHVAFLGRIPGTDRYSDLERHPDNQTFPGIAIFRVEASLLYFNVDHVRQVLRQRLTAIPDLRLVICDLSGSPNLDVAGAELLAALCTELEGRRIRLRIVDAHARARDLLRAIGLEERVGYFGRRLSIEQAIRAYEAENHSNPHDSSLPLS